MLDRKRTTSTSTGSALVVVLWCLAILSVVVVSAAHTTTLETRLVKNTGDSVQAYYLAVAGVEKAKAVIYRESKGLGSGRMSYVYSLYDSPSEFKDVELGSGVFRVIRDTNRYGHPQITYGVEDEERRMNVNYAGAQELARLPRMDEVAAASIVDWRDDDDKVSPNGAEAEHYARLQPPYTIGNGPIETLQEMLMIRGVTPTLLLGEDHNANGRLDTVENDGDRNAPLDNRDGTLQRGLSAYLSFDSAVPNVNARGEDRLDITWAFAEELAALDGIDQKTAEAIVAHREKKQFDSIFDLLEVRSGGGGNDSSNAGKTVSPQGGGVPTVAPSAEGASFSFEEPLFFTESGDIVPASPGDGESRDAERAPSNNEGNNNNQPGGGGAPLVSLDLLKRIADDITAVKERTLHGVVNLNTASWEVLACLEGLNEDLARAIVDHREGSGYFENVVELVDVPGISLDVVKKLSPRLTVRGGTFRVVSEGVIPSSGVRRRIETVIRLGTFDVDTLYYREDS